jgi:hypothetical protein
MIDDLQRIETRQQTALMSSEALRRHRNRRWWIGMFVIMLGTIYLAVTSPPSAAIPPGTRLLTAAITIGVASVIRFLWRRVNDASHHPPSARAADVLLVREQRSDATPQPTAKPADARGVRIMKAIRQIATALLIVGALAFLVSLMQPSPTALSPSAGSAAASPSRESNDRSFDRWQIIRTRTQRGEWLVALARMAHLDSCRAQSPCDRSLALYLRCSPGRSDLIISAIALDNQTTAAGQRVPVQLRLDDEAVRTEYWAVDPNDHRTLYQHPAQADRLHSDIARGHSHLIVDLSDAVISTMPVIATFDLAGADTALVPFFTACVVERAP